jgi:arylsulfatase A-like enzyme
MNVILIVSDTMRRDHLGAYGNDWIRTPHLDALAATSTVFDRAYAASFPTVPNRFDTMTGRFTFTYFDWAPLPREAVVMSEVLGAAGYTTMMVADTPHILQSGFNFDRGFSAFEWIRGQENDRWKTAPDDPPLPAHPSKLREPERTVKQYLRNVSGRHEEQDYFVARTMRAAAQWLEENRDQPFFLYVDTFDPHEPWDPPQWYVDLYDPGYTGEEVTYPLYNYADYLSPAELRHMRALYAGEVSLVDTWVGHLLERVEELGLADDTMVIFTTDHGFYHGEHNRTGKSHISPQGFSYVPLCTEVAAIPLMVRLPGQTAAQRLGAFAQPPDLFPTVLDFLGVTEPGTTNGASLLPLIEGKRRCNRDLAITSPSLAHDPNGGIPTTITSEEWSLVYFGDPAGPAAQYTTRAVDSLTRQTEEFAVPPPELFHLPSDPNMERNVADEHADVARDLVARHVKMLEGLGCDEAYLRHRRGF